MHLAPSLRNLSCRTLSICSFNINCLSTIRSKISANPSLWKQNTPCCPSPFLPRTYGFRTFLTDQSEQQSEEAQTSEVPKKRLKKAAVETESLDSDSAEKPKGRRKKKVEDESELTSAAAVETKSESKGKRRKKSVEEVNESEESQTDETASDQEESAPLKMESFCDKDFSDVEKDGAMLFADRTPAHIVGVQRSEYNGGVVGAVQHTNGWRTLQFGRQPTQIQSGVKCTSIDPTNPENVEIDPDYIACRYMKTMVAAGVTFMQKNLGEKMATAKVLIVGLGAGSLPNFLAKHYPEMNVTVCEIDQAVVDIAKKYFGYKDHPNVNVVVKDAKEHIVESRRTYDVIFVDAFNEVGPESNFLTKSVLRACKLSLQNKDSLVVSNVHVHADFQDIMNLYRGIFNPLISLKVPGEGNAIVVGGLNQKQSNKDEITSIATTLTHLIKPHYDLAKELKYGVEHGVQYNDGKISFWIRSGLSNW